MSKNVLRMSENYFRELIAEELSSPTQSAVDHKAAAGILSKASKLLAAIETFKDGMTNAVSNATSMHLDELQKQLLAMVDKPTTYVDKIKAAPIVKKFKPVVPGKE